MDHDRKEGVIKKTIGRIKERAGQGLGDRKTEADGRRQRAEGEVQNTVGGIKDSFHDNQER